ncbi:MAG: 4-hydroxythreonine-4-phosphate dehydrogenase PdxA [Lachnospiraceae bacterium]|nr:4-hydroxythreonine-4-phosphate dehydrogenase PdxA [Lachnospiraceae bacterium]
MLKCMVFADDFTGALDTGVTFASRGILTVVKTERNLEGAEETEVLVIDTESRHLPPKVAYERLYLLGREAANVSAAYVLKKTDSAMRGNAGTEFAGLMAGIHANKLAFLPAYPETRRFVQDGVLLIDGVPVSQTGFGVDPLNPVVHDLMKEILAEQTELPILSGKDYEAEGSEGIFVFEEKTREEMDAATEKLCRQGEKPVLLGGCAGVGISLAKVLADADASMELTMPKAPALIISGSVHPVSREQIQRVEESGVRCFHLKEDPVTEAGKAEEERVYSETLEAFARGETVLHDWAGVFHDDLFYKVFLEIKPQSLMVIGGDTLTRCMYRLGVDALAPEGEYETGVVSAHYKYQGEEKHIITKSGGFGKPDVLERLFAGRQHMKPIVGITMGDPAGNGPEITVKALAHQEIYDRCRPIVVGDAKMLSQARTFVGREDIQIHVCEKVSDALFTYGTIDVLHLDLIEDPAKFAIGKVSVEGGNAAFQSVKKVIELAMAGEVDATVTNALNKEAMNLALASDNGAKSDGYTHFDGHTEIYATYTGTKKYTMMLAHHDLRVVHVSTHVSLREACDRVKKARVLEVIEIANQACLDMGIEKPKVAVAGLNPHCGEHGLFGTEEIDEIIPAIEEAKAKGIQAIGPIPPDSVFSEALGGWYDIVVCMYHDQGHIPLKTVGFVYDREAQNWKAVEGVNVTLGLPIIRTSVDHGTGFALAGKGTSNELSLVNAIDYAIMMQAGRSAK